MNRLELKFGRGPVDYQDVLQRLPSDDHPLLGTDRAIEALNVLRWALEGTHRTNGGLTFADSLGGRMISLSAEHMRLLERYSFKRRRLKTVYLEWSALFDPDNAWAKVYPTGDDAYKQWQIFKMHPSLPPTDPFILACIETNNSFEKRGPIEYKVGLITRQELRDLLEGLGDPDSFKNFESLAGAFGPAE